MTGLLSHYQDLLEFLTTTEPPDTVSGTTPVLSTQVKTLVSVMIHLKVIKEHES